MTATIKRYGCDFQICDDDVVNPDDYSWSNGTPWVLHDQGFVVAVVFADCEQDAIDEAADDGRLDRWKLTEEEIKRDYTGDDEERISYLGNCCEPYDIENMDYFSIPNPPFSFTALVLAAGNELRHEEWHVDSREKAKLERENRWLDKWRETVSRCLKEGNLEGAHVACERSYEEVPS